MKRDYESGESWDVKFFTGVEVELTPAFGMKTLFVTRLQDVEEIQRIYKKEKCEHIFFGANHSFNPTEEPEWNEWEYMIKNFLKEKAQELSTRGHEKLLAILRQLKVEMDEHLLLFLQNRLGTTTTLEFYQKLSEGQITPDDIKKSIKQKHLNIILSFLCGTPTELHTPYSHLSKFKKPMILSIPF